MRGFEGGDSLVYVVTKVVFRLLFLLEDGVRGDKLLLHAKLQ